MKDVLRELRERFEFILLDSTPVIAISDAAVLSVLTDGVLLVFDGHRTSTACAQKAVGYLDTVRAHFLGVVINAINLKNPDYSYYRTYSQYYHSDDNQELPEGAVKDSDDTVTTLHVDSPLPQDNRLSSHSGSAAAFLVCRADDRVWAKIRVAGTWSRVASAPVAP